MCGESNPNGPRIGWLLCVDAPTATHRACAIFRIHTHNWCPEGVGDVKAFVSPNSPSGQLFSWPFLCESNTHIPHWGKAWYFAVNTQLLHYSIKGQNRPAKPSYLVRRERLELSILAALASETSVYTIPPPTHYAHELYVLWSYKSSCAVLSAQHLKGCWLSKANTKRPINLSGSVPQSGV